MRCETERREEYRERTAVYISLPSFLSFLMSVMILGTFGLHAWLPVQFISAMMSRAAQNHERVLCLALPCLALICGRN